MKKKILILGVGNYLMGDEGLGVHFIQRLEGHDLPKGVDKLDGGTAGFQLMEYLENYHTIIMIDATLDQHPAGTIRLIQPRFASDFPRAMSTHEIGLKDLVESLVLMNRLPTVFLYVVSVEDIAALRVTLSPAVEEALTRLRQLVLGKVTEELKRLEA